MDDDVLAGTRVLVIGGNRRFHYYRCGECAEIWTVDETWGRRHVSKSRDSLPLMH